MERSCDARKRGRLRHERCVSCALGVLMGFSPFIRQHPTIAPVLFFDLLNDNVSVFWLLSQDTNQSVSEIPNDFRLLLSSCSLRYLNIHIGHEQLLEKIREYEESVEVEGSDFGCAKEPDLVAIL